jgi:adenosylcobinamide kinase / adenosylcobinamide-phosphate guanylyltransferase
MTNKIILITGGQRSGKSTYAQQLALSLSENPVYLATSAVWDDEHRQRIERHQRDRGPQWTNMEELKDLHLIDLEGRVVVVDCVTLWATNFFTESNGDVEYSYSAIIERFDKLIEQDATLIFVTNELGLGGTTTNDLQRRFNDLLGWVNQHIAAKTDEVILMISGIKMKIK